MENQATPTRLTLPASLSQAFETTLADWQEGQKVKRLWNGDATLWSSSDEARWLGWLNIVTQQINASERWSDINQWVREAKFTHAVVLGMGGSSLCPDVLAKTFHRAEGFPELRVLDSTNPTQINSLERSIDLRRTLFIVSSKSGSTLEPNIFLKYFYGRVSELSGAAQAGRQFIAITDPGSKMEATAQSLSFRAIYHGVPSIGGRYSALSDFGMVPAAVMGLDVPAFLARAQQMVDACQPNAPFAENPGLILGIALGVAARRGRDKVTFVTSPALAELGAWLEQLIAESTGKKGLGIIPIDGEPLATPTRYGEDRVFVELTFQGSRDEASPKDLEHSRIRTLRGP